VYYFIITPIICYHAYNALQLSRYNYKSTEQMMKVVRSIILHMNVQIRLDAVTKYFRAVGRELMSAAQSELTIGNLIRRVLFFIREEYANQLK